MSETGGHSPMHQFEVHKIIEMNIGGLDVSFTNASLFMVFAMISISIFFMIGMRRHALVPGRWQSATEAMYEFVANMLRDNVGAEGKRYFPFIFTLFMFVLTCNLLGMLPYSFTVTSHIVVTFALAILIFIGVTIIGFMRHGAHYFHLFLPDGVPWWMAPLMVFIELLAYLARPVTLSVRLAANMMAGHTMLKVIAGFVAMMGLFGVLPIALLIILVGFEIFVAVLQAYIFTVLTCVYLNDAVHMH